MVQGQGVGWQEPSSTTLADHRPRPCSSLSQIHTGSWEPTHLFTPSLQTFRTSTIGERGSLLSTPYQGTINLPWKCVQMLKPERMSWQFQRQEVCEGRGWHLRHREPPTSVKSDRASNTPALASGPVSSSSKRHRVTWGSESLRPLILLDHFGDNAETEDQSDRCPPFQDCE